MDSEDIRRVIDALKYKAKFEIFVVTSSGESIEIEKGELKYVYTGDISTASVRCILDKRSSVANGKIEKINDLKDLTEQAYKLARFGSTDTQSDFSNKQPRILSADKNGRPISKNKNITDYIIKSAAELNRSDKIYSVNVYFSTNSTKISGANTNGITVDRTDSSIALNSSVIAKDGNDQASGGWSTDAVDISKADVDENLGKASKMAVSMLKSRQAPTVRGQLLVDAVASKLFVDMITTAMSGERILRKRSFLCGKKSEKIASECFNLTENINVKGSAHNSPFDDEMYPSSSKELISNGILRTYLHNIYSSEKLGEKNTGNCFHSPDGSIGTTNVLIRGHGGKAADMIPKIKRGIYLIDTGDSPNLMTGDLSAMVMAGYYIEGGEIKYPVKETMVGLNLLKAMKNISWVGDDVLSGGGFYCPSMLIDDVQISGK